MLMPCYNTAGGKEKQKLQLASLSLSCVSLSCLFPCFRKEMRISTLVSLILRGYDQQSQRPYQNVLQ